MVDWHDLLWGETCLKIMDTTINGIKCFNYYQKGDGTMEKGEDINLEKDIYYKNLSYIDEIKGTPIQFGEPSVDKNYLKMEMIVQMSK